MDRMWSVVIYGGVWKPDIIEGDVIIVNVDVWQRERKNICSTRENMINEHNQLVNKRKLLTQLKIEYRWSTSLKLCVQQI